MKLSDNRVEVLNKIVRCPLLEHLELDHERLYIKLNGLYPGYLALCILRCAIAGYFPGQAEKLPSELRNPCHIVHVGMHGLEGYRQPFGAAFGYPHGLPELLKLHIRINHTTDKANGHGRHPTEKQDDGGGR